MITLYRQLWDREVRVFLADILIDRSMIMDQTIIGSFGTDAICLSLFNTFRSRVLSNGEFGASLDLNGDSHWTNACVFAGKFIISVYESSNAIDRDIFDGPINLLGQTYERGYFNCNFDKFMFGNDRYFDHEEKINLMSYLHYGVKQCYVAIQLKLCFVVDDKNRVSGQNYSVGDWK